MDKTSRGTETQVSGATYAIREDRLSSTGAALCLGVNTEGEAGPDVLNKHLDKKGANEQN